jgi:hypothetical protein
LLATIALVLAAFGLMLGIVKPADAPKHIGAIPVIVVGLMVVPGILSERMVGYVPMATDHSHCD